MFDHVALSPTARMVSPTLEDRAYAMQMVIGPEDSLQKQRVLAAADNDQALAVLKHGRSGGAGGCGPGSGSHPAYWYESDTKELRLMVGRNPDRWQYQHWRGEPHYFYLLKYCEEVAKVRLKYKDVVDELRTEQSQMSLL